MARQPNPSKADLWKVSSDYSVLYQHEGSSPLVRPLPIYLAPFPIDNRVLTESEFEAEVQSTRTQI